MNRLVRHPVRGFADYAGVGLFLVAYLAVLGITFAPSGTFGTEGDAATASPIALP